MAEMAGLSAPTMDWASTDVPQAFNKFKTICQLMFDDTLAEKTEAVNVKYLFLWSREEGIEVSSTGSYVTLSQIHWDRFGNMWPQKQLQNCYIEIEIYETRQSRKC